MYKKIIPNPLDNEYRGLSTGIIQLIGYFDNYSDNPYKRTGFVRVDENNTIGICLLNKCIIDVENKYFQYLYDDIIRCIDFFDSLNNKLSKNG